MKILQVHTRYREPGGEDAVVAAEANLLTRAGHEVVSYVAENPTGAMSSAALLALSAWNPPAARALGSTVARVRPDVAHVHNTWYALSPSVLSALDRAGVPVVMTLHNFRLMCVNALLFRDGRPCHDCVGTRLPWPGVRHRCYRGSLVASAAAGGAIGVNRTLRTWHRHVRLFLALNDFAREQFLLDGFPADKLRVKQNFITDPGPRAQPPSASRTLLYVGRLSVEKGVRTLLDAWRAVDDDRLELVIVGDGPLRAELQRDAPANVQFRGWVPPSEVRRLMLRSRALLFPSIWYESADPQVVIEALACGLPVLASKLGGNVALLKPVGEQWLLAPGHRASWTSGLRVVWDDDQVDRSSMWLRKIYDERFSEQIALPLLEDAYATARHAGP